MVDIAVERFDTPDGRALNSAYFAELRKRFPAGYEPGDVLTTLDEDLSPPNGAFLVVREAGLAIGCGGMKQLDAATAEVKHMYVDPGHRGARVGALILTSVEDHARSLGLTRAVLDTNGCLAEAVSMYRRKGYVEIPPYNDNVWATHWFAKGLT